MEIVYTAEPTAQKFHASPATVRGFMGPVGNGKSVTCIQEGLRLSREQYPNAQGVRKSRGVIVRNTSPELRTTTLNTWHQWVPDRICTMTMNPVIEANVKMRLNDGTTVELQVYFLAMDKDKDVKKLLSLECTWVFLNEARELPYGVVKAARERIGRYPSAIDGYMDSGDYKAPDEPCTRKALLMDTNPPETDHWWYHLAEEGHLPKAKNKDHAIAETRRIFEFFRGPAPLVETEEGVYEPSPKAENINHLPGGYQYYLDMIAGNTQDHINVMVLGNYGSIQEGRPVYPQYNDLVHCPNPVGAIKGIPICLGWDFGLTPACVIGQLTDTGQCRIIWELCSEDMQVREFARDVVKPFLQTHFAEWTIGFSLGDPAGNARGEGEGRSSIAILNDEEVEDDDVIVAPLNMGFTTDPAPTNDPTKRIDAVASFMTKMVDQGQPGYLLSSKCVQLRRGKQGGYHYKRVQVAGDERYRDKPDKNKYSHPADAEQYLCLGFRGGYVTDVSDDDLHYDDYETQRTGGAMGY